MLRLDRIFYPVGQGGFYAERFYYGDKNIFNAVYDCGSISSPSIEAPNFAIKIAENAFEDYERINILFISHFDSDHVNMIKNLKAEIENVVMPLITQEYFNILELLNISSKVNENFIREVTNGTYDKFRGSKKIWIKPKNNNYTDNDYISVEEGENSVVIDSGVDILDNIVNYDQLMTLKIWSYIPYNFKFAQRNKGLKGELNKFLQEKNMNLTCFDVKKLIPNDLKKIKSIYEKFFKKINCKKSVNENSMCVYSGLDIKNSRSLLDLPSPINSYLSPVFSLRPYVVKEEKELNLDIPRRMLCGALYTGDADLNNTDLDEKLSYYLEHIGMFQIPHHGADKDFNLKRMIKLKNQNVICPISYSTKNNYGHPSAHVLIKLMENGFFPIPITEKRETKTTIRLFLSM